MIPIPIKATYEYQGIRLAKDDIKQICNLIMARCISDTMTIAAGSQILESIQEIDELTESEISFLVIKAAFQPQNRLSTLLPDHDTLCLRIDKKVELTLDNADNIEAFGVLQKVRSILTRRHSFYCRSQPTIGIIILNIVFWLSVLACYIWNLNKSVMFFGFILGLVLHAAIFLACSGNRIYLSPKKPGLWARQKENIENNAVTTIVALIIGGIAGSIPTWLLTRDSGDTKSQQQTTVKQQASTTQPATAPATKPTK